MSTPANRSTLVQLAMDYCPRAIDHEQAGQRADRSLFQQGIAAHAVLQMVAAEQNRLDRELTPAEIEAVGASVVEVLVTEGRAFDGVPEPAMHPDDAMGGRDIALTYLGHASIPIGADPEVPVGVDDTWTPTEYGPDAYWRAALDRIEVAALDDEESVGTTVIVTDYKSAWPTDESELDTLQLRGQALLAVALHPEADYVQQQVVNLRTGRLFKRSILLDEDGQMLLARWRNDIKLAITWAETRGKDGRRRAFPGAGCYSCPFGHVCDAKNAESAPDERIALALEYTDLKGRLEIITPKLRAMTKEAPIRLADGSFIGYIRKKRRKLAENASEVVLATTRQLFGDETADPTSIPWRDRHASELTMLSGLSVGVTNVEKLAKKLFSRRTAADRDRFVEAITEDAYVSEFGVTKGEGE